MAAQKTIHSFHSEFKGVLRGHHNSREPFISLYILTIIPFSSETPPPLVWEQSVPSQ